MFDLLPEPNSAQTLGRRLAELVRGERLPHQHRLRRHPDRATRCATRARRRRLPPADCRPRCPSWLYPVTMGATTIWERWDSMLPDGIDQPGRDDLVQPLRAGRGRRLAAPHGRRPGAGDPGLRRIRIAPQPLTGFDFAEARHLTPYGPASVRWDRDGDRVLVVAEVPPNSRAEVLLPDGTQLEVDSGRHTWTVTAPATDTSRPPVSLESTLADLVDDPEAFAATWRSRRGRLRQGRRRPSAHRLAAGTAGQGALRQPGPAGRSGAGRRHLRPAERDPYRLTLCSGWSGSARSMDRAQPTDPSSSGGDLVGAEPLG